MRAKGAAERARCGQRGSVRPRGLGVAERGTSQAAGEWAADSRMRGEQGVGRRPVCLGSVETEGGGLIGDACGRCVGGPRGWARLACMLLVVGGAGGGVVFAQV